MSIVSIRAFVFAWAMIVVADVIRVRVRVDDRRHALVADGFDVVADGASPAGRLGVDQHDALVTHQRQRVAAAGEHVEDVADVERLHPDDLVALGHERRRQQQRAGDEYCGALHTPSAASDAQMTS
jgi:hypothetical protein